MREKDYLHVALFDNRYLVHRRALEAYQKYAMPYIYGRLLDIGCGQKTMESFFSDMVTEHVGLDQEGSLHGHERVDVIATAYRTEQPAVSYDTVLCTAVLEHLEEPEKALREACRVLRPGGYALYTIPFFWHLHEEPRDFYRYTKYGIKYLFEKAGFKIVELKPLSGFWITFGSEFNYYISGFARGPLRILIKPIIAMNNLIFLTLDKIDRKINKGAEKWTWMYLVVVRKPEKNIDDTR